MTLAFLVMLGRALGLFRSACDYVVVLVLARPTEAKPVVIQFAGRVVRPTPALTDCSILTEGFDDAEEFQLSGLPSTCHGRVRRRIDGGHAAAREQAV